MINDKNVNKILYGGDYNPEQWSLEERKRDMELLPEAGIDIVTLNVFSWARLQPSENEYDFSDLDRIVNMVTEKGMKICMATSTAAHPAWMARKYPDILRTDIDGRKHNFGSRHNSCPNSPTYKKYAPLLAKKLAERYGKNTSILAWHISNEYGGLCYCENCKKAWRQWLKNKYGTIENLNQKWNSAFWSHTYYDWDDIQVPDHISERWNYNRTNMQIQTIDYYRFNTEGIVNMYRMEADAIHSVLPDAKVTTNLMSTYPELDYAKFAPYMDFISWDNYPSPDDSYTRTAFNHEVMRGLKRDKPFCLMEQTPSVTNWQPYNSLKRPGVMRLMSYQAVAHGADTVMFFQMRRSRGCCEKFHGAVIDHYPTSETRVFKETAALGKELKKLSDSFLGSTEKAEAAILFDWNCMWGVMFSSGPSVDFKYTDEVYKYYDAFCKLNISVDVISPEESLDRYKVVIAPALYMISEKNAAKIQNFVEKGGAFLTTVMSGMTDENDLVTDKGYPGELRKVCGIWAEETDALLPGKPNSLVIKEGKLKGEYPALILADIIHPDTAEVIATYGSDFYAGTPVLTKNSFGKGKAWYAGCCFDKNDSFLRKLILNITEEAGIKQLLPEEEGIETTCRVSAEGKKFYFILNQNSEDKKITLPLNARDLLTDKTICSGDSLLIKAKDLLILEIK
ncbi:beta-galactosidase [Treponema sp.]|uniref:beta-galactosidase n=1 Tax=Treponema sp. TaxID=166 RepID=UPI0025EA374F|nr:beta-galactosidase [Treponema sp.]MCR5218184.1 beta-galactosidase [Treponema sp.]